MRRAALLLLLLAACSGKRENQSAVATGGGNAVHGRMLVQQYGCTSCHIIPGVPGPQGEIGPSLKQVGHRPLIAGKFRNTPQNMMRWLQNPQAMDPKSLMPSLGVTPTDSRDMTAFMYTLR